MKQGMILIGAGGHCKSIIAVLKSAGEKVVGILDDNSKKHGETILGTKILGGVDLVEKYKDKLFLIAIGDNKTRLKISEKLKKSGVTFGNAIHPTAVIANDVKIGPGTVVMANATINTGGVIGSHVIINTASTVDHDNCISDYVHLSTGCVTCGSVQIGEATWIGTGTIVINNTSIGSGVITGAGSVIIKDVPNDVLVVGVPAKIKKELK